VIYEAKRSAPPAFASLGNFTLKFGELDTFSYNPHSRADPGTTKHENILSEGRRGA